MYKKNRAIYTQILL